MSLDKIETIHRQQIQNCHLIFGSIDRVQDLRTGGHWFNPWALPIFFLRIDDSHCIRIHSSLTAVHCFQDGYVRKQPVAWKEYCAEVLVKITQQKHG